MTYNIYKNGLEELKKTEPNRFENNLKGADYINLVGADLELPIGMEKERLERLAKITRGLVFAAVEAGQSGHPGGSSGKVEQILSLVLNNDFKYDFLAPKNPGRDRVVWSAGHCTPALYGILSLVYESLRRAGRQFSPAVIHSVFPEDLIRFRRPDGPQGHAESHYPLVDYSTGPSGHGFSAAGGMAMVHKSCGLDTKVWIMMGDAETEEGLTYEARNILSTMKINNAVALLDYNHFGIDGPIEQVIGSPYINHWLGLGWNVIEINGHDFGEVLSAQHLAAKGFANGLPTVVLSHSLKGKDYGPWENSEKSHGTPAPHNDYVQDVRQLGFDIPGKEGNAMLDIEKILESLSEDDVVFINRKVEESAERIAPEKDLVEKMSSFLKDRPLTDPLSIRRPKELPSELVFEGKKATRKAAAACFEWLMKQTAFFYAGAGDLSGSVGTAQAEKVYGLITPDNPTGRGIRFGIAEPNMAMMSIGLTQDILPGGFHPVSVFGTYAVFTSMIANCVRLGLINNHLCPERKGFFIMEASHDGPETGEDGPTHQGLYWMSLYNAYPGIKVYKPLDANETVEMLFFALEKGEPIALSLSRPDTPVLERREGVPSAKEAINGAYVYKNFKENGKQKKVLVISGGMVLLKTLEVLDKLEKKFDVKITAVTSPELFEDLRKRDPKKAESIFSEKDRKIAVCLHNGWKGFLYPFLLPGDYQKRSIGIETYLKSGNAKEVYEVAQMTAEDILEKVVKS